MGSEAIKEEACLRGKREYMPLVEIKYFEGELSEAQTQEVIEKVTDVLVSFSGEALREATWVVVQEVKSGHWGLAVRR